MSKVHYQALGPLLSGEGSRAFLGLEISREGAAQPVVLVWIPEEANRDAELFERIRRETEHAASLDHPNIVKVYGFATLDEGTARVVEFADGESLRRVLDVTQRLPMRVAARIAADAATGVHYAHVAGNDDGSPLLHGDLRPETILLSFSGVTKVAGYGALNVAPREMGGQRVKGRRLHCAPEQVLGGREAINRQTDVYLLGLTLHELLAGVVPFEFELDFDQAVLTKPLPMIESAEVPSALRDVIARATAKKAGDRYPTALAFKEAIEKAVGGLPPVEELSGYLREYFPPSEQKRAARRRAIDEGIADFARRQWDLEKSASRPAISLPPEPVAPAPEPPAPRVAKPIPNVRAEVKPRRVIAPPPEVEEEAEISGAYVAPPRKSLAKLAVPAVVLVGGGLVAALALSGGGKQPAPAPTPVAPVVAAVVDAGPAEVAAIGLDAGTAEETPAAEERPPAEAPAPVVEKPPEAPPSLELQVEPSVELVIDGTPSGRSPFSGPLAPGRHTVQLVDKAKGISTSRVVVVKPKGVTQERIFLSRGYVSISAPDGAVIFIDGKQVGTAPIKEISVYEGSHRILVTVGKAKWQQAFSVRGSERMYFNVETE